jgi:hypothetical protein
MLGIVDGVAGPNLEFDLEKPRSQYHLLRGRRSEAEETYDSGFSRSSSKLPNLQLDLCWEFGEEDELVQYFVSRLCGCHDVFAVLGHCYERSCEREIAISFT